MTVSKKTNLRRRDNHLTMLEQLLKERGMKQSTLYNDLDISRQTFSSSFTKSKQPRKEFMLTLAIGLRLSFEETNKFLYTAGYILSEHLDYDKIFSENIRKGNYDMKVINDNILNCNNTLVKEKTEYEHYKWFNTIRKEKGMTLKSLCINSTLSYRTFNKQFRRSKKPTKKIMITIAIGLHLPLDKTNEFLKIAGYILSECLDYDCTIIEHIILEKFQIFEINDALSNKGLDSNVYKLLGSSKEIDKIVKW